MFEKELGARAGRGARRPTRERPLKLVLKKELLTRKGYEGRQSLPSWAPVTGNGICWAQLFGFS